MSSLDVKFTDQFSASLDAYERKVKEQVLIAGAAAMAKSQYDEVKLNTSGSRATGSAGAPPNKLSGLLDSAIYRVFAKGKSTDYVKTYQISWNHRKAPHGFNVEFGNSKTSAHPFVRPAFDHIDTAIQAGQDRMRAKLAGAP